MHSSHVGHRRGAATGTQLAPHLSLSRSTSQVLPTVVANKLLLGICCKKRTAAAGLLPVQAAVHRTRQRRCRGRLPQHLSCRLANAAPRAVIHVGKRTQSLDQKAADVVLLVRRLDLHGALAGELDLYIGGGRQQNEDNERVAVGIYRLTSCEECVQHKPLPERRHGFIWQRFTLPR